MIKRFSLILSSLCLVAFSAAGHAASVTFSDNSRYWGDNAAGWSSTQKWNTDVANGYWNGNVIDVIGDPDVTGGTAVFTANGNLRSITFNYYTPDNDWSMLAPGNLFVNVLNGSADTTWDYVVNTLGNPLLGTPTGNRATLPAGSYNIYNVTSLNIDAKKPANFNGDAYMASLTSPYLLSGKDNTQNAKFPANDWRGIYIRDYHPIAVTQSLLTNTLKIGQAQFSGFPNVSGYQTIDYADVMVGSATYDFGVNGLNLYGKDIIIGWGITCANDEVYEKILNPSSVPEPGSVLLLGAGLFCLAIYSKRKKESR